MGRLKDGSPTRVLAKNNYFFFLFKNNAALMLKAGHLLNPTVQEALPLLFTYQDIIYFFFIYIKIGELNLTLKLKNFKKN